MSGRHVERLKERRVGVLCALTGLTPFGYISVVVPSVAQADVPAPSPSATSAPAQVPCCGGGGSGELLSGQELTAGQAVWSPGGGYYLTMQTDGNLVEYTSSGQALWASDTNSEPGNYAVMQTDGNLVVYSSGGQWIWQTRTNGYGGAYLAVQDDSNVVVYSSSSSALWAKSWNSSVTGAQRYAQQIFFHYGWNVSQQYQYLNDLWTRESNWLWDVCSGYPSGPYYPNCPYTSVAYGIPQALPSSKMGSVTTNPTGGPDWTTDGLTQVGWGLNYIYETYGNPYNAWEHELQYGWYVPTPA